MWAQTYEITYARTCFDGKSRNYSFLLQETEDTRKSSKDTPKVKKEKIVNIIIGKFYLKKNCRGTAFFNTLHM